MKVCLLRMIKRDLEKQLTKMDPFMKGLGGEIFGMGLAKELGDKDKHILVRIRMEIVKEQEFN